MRELSNHAAEICQYQTVHYQTSRQAFAAPKSQQHGQLTTGRAVTMPTGRLARSALALHGNDNTLEGISVKHGSALCPTENLMLRLPRSALPAGGSSRSTITSRVCVKVCRQHGCSLLKITSRNFSLLEVLRGGSNYQVIFGNYLEAGNLFLSAVEEFFLIENHKNIHSF